VRFRVTTATAAMVAATIACSSDTPTSNQRTTAPQITVADYTFSPDTATITAGDEVIWIWGGSVGHDVTFTTAGAPTNCPLQSSGLCFRTFPTAGTYNFVCSPHAGLMSGHITVRPKS